MKTVLTLPFPPSVNNLFPTSRSGHRFKSEQYKAWLTEAGYSILAQPRNRHTGPVEVIYSLCPPDKRRRDVFNYEKAISDLLVAQGVLADDSLIQRGTIQWAEGPPVTVMIRDINEA